MTIEEQFRRQIKASRIMVEMVVRGLDHEVAAYMDEQGWDAICGLAEVPPASWRTREVVIGLLERHDEAQQRMAAMMDPFDFEVVS